MILHLIICSQHKLGFEIFYQIDKNQNMFRYFNSSNAFTALCPNHLSALMPSALIILKTIQKCPNLGHVKKIGKWLLFSELSEVNEI